MTRRFKDLSAPEVLGLAISLEEEDARILQEFARLLRPNYPRAAEELQAMRREEDGHRHRLVELFRRRVWRRDSADSQGGRAGLRPPRSAALAAALGRAAGPPAGGPHGAGNAAILQPGGRATSDAELRQLLGDLAEAERRHEMALRRTRTRPPARKRKGGGGPGGPAALRAAGDSAGAGGADGRLGVDAGAAVCRRLRHHAHGGGPGTWATFLVGLAASVGAAISMGFAEALSDDGSMTGRGRPLLRGLVCALMTFCGGIFHALPFLIPHFALATGIATGVVAVELLAIAWIRNRYMDSPFVTSVLQVVLGGVLVFLAGILIGSS